MKQAFICDAIRTPIGRFGGALKDMRADDLGAVPLRALQQRLQDAIANRESDEEIAAAMELTVPAVKSLLFRARVQLREALGPYMGGGTS